MSKSIIITGAGRGIGKACAERFLEAGWRVGLVGRNAAALQQAAAGHAKAQVMECDVTDPDAVTQVFEKAVESWGHLDAIINNAGVSLLSTTID